jgi:hypothetical protein
VLSLAVKGYAGHPSVMLGMIVLVLHLAALGAAAYLVTTLAVFPFALLIEGDGVWDSFRKSAALTRGSFWPVLRGHGLYLAVVLAVGLPFVIGLKMVEAHPVIIAAVVETIAIVFFPFMVGYYFYIYLSLKKREARAAIAVYDRN